jgi:REP-associated tyrosine transposase
MARPVRLREVSYAGFAAYFVTTCTLDRVCVFENVEFGRLVADALLSHARANAFAVPAYCLMPDHAHIIMVGTQENSSLCEFVKDWKQASGFQWSQRGNGKLWQIGYWDRVLREDEAILSVARYVIENPVRAKLVREPAEYPLLGSSEYTIAEILEAVQMNWGRRWRSS